MEYQYNGAPHQYTEKAMEKRIRKLGRQIRKHRGFDIMITHALRIGSMIPRIFVIPVSSASGQ